MVYVGFFKKKASYLVQISEGLFVDKHSKTFSLHLVCLIKKGKLVKKTRINDFDLKKHIFCLQELEKTHLIGWGQDL